MIVDASVALKWFLDEPLSQEARALIAQEDLKAPDLIVTEVLNGLRKAVRDQRLTMASAIEAIPRIELAIPTIAPASLFAEQALRMAVQLGHPVQDCLYLAFAFETDSVLITADQAFQALVLASEWRDHVALLLPAA